MVAKRYIAGLRANGKVQSGLNKDKQTSTRIHAAVVVVDGDKVQTILYPVTLTVHEHSIKKISYLINFLMQSPRKVNVACLKNIYIFVSEGSM